MGGGEQWGSRMGDESDTHRSKLREQFVKVFQVHETAEERYGHDHPEVVESRKEVHRRDHLENREINSHTRRYSFSSELLFSHSYVITTEYLTLHVYIHFAERQIIIEFLQNFDE